MSSGSGLLLRFGSGEGKSKSSAEMIIIGASGSSLFLGFDEMVALGSVSEGALGSIFGGVSDGVLGAGEVIFDPDDSGAVILVNLGELSTREVFFFGCGSFLSSSGSVAMG